jgi:hypothetical protein
MRPSLREDYTIHVKNAIRRTDTIVIFGHLFFFKKADTAFQSRSDIGERPQRREPSTMARMPALLIAGIRACRLSEPSPCSGQRLGQRPQRHRNTLNDCCHQTCKNLRARRKSSAFENNSFQDR